MWQSHISTFSLVRNAALSVDGKTKRIRIDAFSYLALLMWTKLEKEGQSIYRSLISDFWTELVTR